ncbi:tripartite tricarboxylate transporter substrate binding protein [Terrihabitans rhizophilus]|jgi:tripartite-type tricarboxylate transporter receptor subunit TctC|uniref:Tripartite tricarboxylate transporter substrate binding protein n=1 Tax=Terrihabitans rhizophilus TaxID=3092662 RepID=A0ABU4RKV8_9HYPH|nr:tripartite tricarboxylate transporter substrate binding protein [Terrihabitans sp. PJ23]MDX6804714.1 tripartite tricarboxylate transporter substrate binding protein [Terrihabitans sp. PJ23]
MLSAALFGSAVLLAGSAFAQDAKYPAYPHKTVTLITSSGPGGGGDVFLRNLVKTLGPRWGINFVVENVPGSGGANAMRRIVEGPADGSLLYGVSTQHVVVSVLSNPPYSYKDMQPVVNVLYDSPIFFVRSDSPFKTLQDVVAYAKENPGKLKFGAGTAASIDRMVVETFKLRTGLNMVVATHDSGGQLTLNVLSGAVDIGSGDAQEITAQVEAGQMRILAAVMDTRLANFPDVPTAKEQGVDVTATGWRGFVVKKGTPPEIAQAWEKAIQLVLEDPQYKEFYTKSNGIPAYLSAQDFDALTNKFASELDAFFTQVGLKQKKN